MQWHFQHLTGQRSRREMTSSAIVLLVLLLESNCCSSGCCYCYCCPAYCTRWCHCLLAFGCWCSCCLLHFSLIALVVLVVVFVVAAVIAVLYARWKFLIHVVTSSRQSQIYNVLKCCSQYCSPLALAQRHWSPLSLRKLFAKTFFSCRCFASLSLLAWLLHFNLSTACLSCCCCTVCLTNAVVDFFALSLAVKAPPGWTLLNSSTEFNNFIAKFFTWLCVSMCVCMYVEFKLINVFI